MQFRVTLLPFTYFTRDCVEKSLKKPMYVFLSSSHACLTKEKLTKTSSRSVIHRVIRRKERKVWPNPWNKQLVVSFHNVDA